MSARARSVVPSTERLSGISALRGLDFKFLFSDRSWASHTSAGAGSWEQNAQTAASPVGAPVMFARVRRRTPNPLLRSPRFVLRSDRCPWSPRPSVRFGAHSRATRRDGCLRLNAVSESDGPLLPDASSLRVRRAAPRCLGVCTCIIVTRGGSVQWGVRTAPGPLRISRRPPIRRPLPPRACSRHAP
jgi:hypothetical protein